MSAVEHLNMPSKTQSPKEMPISRADSIMSLVTGTVFLRPIASRIGMDSTFGGQRYHPSECAFADQACVSAPNPRAEDAIEARGKTASLQVSEHNPACFVGGDCS